MILLHASKSRGFFDPVTLGLSAPANFSEMHKYQDEVSLRAWATFFHEFAHYLQFYGSTFGISYLHNVWGQATGLSNVFRSLQKEYTDLEPPLWRLAEKMILDELMSDEEHFFWLRIMLMERYFQEELYGVTYPLFETTPVLNGNSYVQSSPLFLRMATGSYMPVNALSVLEHGAALYDSLFTGTFPDKEIAKKVLNSHYVELGEEANLYVGISTHLHPLGVGHLEHLIYFIILNQSHHEIVSRLGSYSIANNLKTILLNAHKIRGLPQPKNNNEVLEVVSEICKVNSLDNPMESLSIDLGLLRESMTQTHSSIRSVAWISEKVIQWIIDNPFSAIYWASDPSKIMNKIPIWKIRPSDIETDWEINFYDWDVANGRKPDKEELELISQHSRYGDFVHVLHGLFFGERCKCPFFIRQKPNVCEACKECSGTIPDSALTDACPVVKICSKQGIDILSVTIP